jgi:hypothetical protein
MDRHRAEPIKRKSSERRRNSGSRSNAKRSSSSLPISAHPDPQQETDSAPAGKVRTGIVSVNGCDVGVMHCRRP